MRVLRATIGSASDVHPLPGVGLALDPPQFTGRRVAAALAGLLDAPAVQHRCKALAARCDPATALTETDRLMRRTPLAPSGVCAYADRHR